jgi:signal transduction histidine kinase
VLERPAAAAFSGTNFPNAGAAPFEATALDRMIVRAQRAAPMLTRASDVLLCVVAALFAAVDVMIWATRPTVEKGRVSVSVALLVPCLGALSILAVAVRRRYPTGALRVLATTSLVFTGAVWAIGTRLPPSFAALFALALLTAGVLRHQPGQGAIVLASLAAMAVAAEALRPTVSAAGYLLVVCEGAFLVAVGIGLYARWSDFRRVAAEDEARRFERLEIARELHDLVGHYVTGIVVQAQAARHVAERQPAAADAALANIETAGAHAMDAMRCVVGGLRTEFRGVRGDRGAAGASWDAIEQLIADAVAKGEPVRASLDPGIRGASLAFVPSVHRIIAESLTNVRRHAREATSIEVGVFQTGDRLVVTVRNDGRGVVSSGHDTFGIVGMRERASSLGGTLVAGPMPNGGWLVRAELPVGFPR